VSVSIRLYRIGVDNADHTADDMTGLGAASSGGRWNRPKTAMVYASRTRALACLETVVHLGGARPLPLNRYLVEILVPIAVWQARAVWPSIPVGWDAEPAGKVSLDLGTDWAAAGATALAEVPSVIVPEEHSILINPQHPDAALLTAKKIRKWTYDMRLK
jgi:RES domain-containing protein